MTGRVVAISSDNFQVIANNEEGNDSLMVGTGMNWYTNTAPEGFLFCEGQAISRTTYANLFTVIGTTYGSGDGSTTFNLPDRRSRMEFGYDSRDSDFNNLSNTGGAKTLALVLANLTSHNHTFTGTALGTHNHTQNAHAHTKAAHTHTGVSHLHWMTDVAWCDASGSANRYVPNTNPVGNFFNGTHTGRGELGGGSSTPHNSSTTATNNNTTATNQASSAGTPSGTIANSGSGTAFSKLPPYSISRKIIKY